MGDNSIQCPKCGYENKASAIECNKCGVTLSLVLKKSIKNDVAKSEIPPADSQEAGSPNLSICPKCGHDVLPSAAECIKCGIIFSKYFEFQERLKKEEQEKAEAEAIRLEQEKQEAEEIKKAEALQKEAEKEEQKRAETLKKQQDKKEREEKERAEALRKEQEEKDKKDKEKAETEAVVKEKLTVEQLEMQIATLKSDTASLKMDTETLKKAEREAIKKNEASQQKIDSLSQETDTLKLETESLKKEKHALEEAEAKREDAQDAERKAEEEKTEALRKEREDKQKRTETILKTLVPKPNFEELLKKYEGEEIGINYDDPAEIKKAQLAKVNADHFSVLVMENELLYSYPLGNILSIVEAANGVPVDISGETANYPIVVRVLHLMVKKKWSFI